MPRVYDTCTRPACEAAAGVLLQAAIVVVAKAFGVKEHVWPILSVRVSYRGTGLGVCVFVVLLIECVVCVGGVRNLTFFSR